MDEEDVEDLLWLDIELLVFGDLKYWLQTDEGTEKMRTNCESYLAGLLLESIKSTNVLSLVQLSAECRNDGGRQAGDTNTTLQRCN